MAKNLNPLVRYVKAGEFLNGVPARDMTLDEWNDLPNELREQALMLGLYSIDGGENAAHS